MNKAQLIDALATKFDGNRRSASAALEAVLDTITRTVVTGEKVGITGFGVFEKLDKPARTVRNPATGASVKKKKTSVPRFRAGAELKAYVSGEKKFARVPAAKKVAAPAKAVATKSVTPAATPARATKTAVKAPAEKVAATKAPAAKRASKTATPAVAPAAPAKAAPSKRATRTAAAAPAKTVVAAKATTKAAPARRAPRTKA